MFSIRAAFAASVAFSRSLAADRRRAREMWGRADLPSGVQ